MSSDKELADIDAELARRGVAPPNDDIAQLDAEIARRKGQRNPGTAGIVNFGAGLAGLPVDTVAGAMNLGIAGYGALKGALTGDPGASPEPIKAPFGGSESIRSGLRATGVDVLNPDNPTPGSKEGTAAYDFASRGGFIPGGALSAAGSMLAEKVAGPQWAGVGAMLPSAAIAGYNELRAPSLARQEARNQVRDKTIKEARDEGYVLPPSQSNPTFIGNRAEGFAGKANVKQDAAIRNQGVTDDIVRREIGLPENAPITMQTVGNARDAFAQPYREVSALSSRAKTALELLKQARADAKEQWFHYDRSGHPDAKAAATNYDAKAGAYERVLEMEAGRAGKPDLIQQLREARTNIAKTFDVERALNLGDGTVDAHTIGRIYDKGAHLTGGLETIAKFALGPGKQVSRPAASTPAPGVGALEHAGSAGLALAGFHQFGLPGILMGGIPFARHGVRHAMLSEPYQNNFAQPSYGPAMQPELPPQLAARLSVLLNEQQQK